MPKIKYMIMSALTGNVIAERETLQEVEQLKEKYYKELFYYIEKKEII